MNTLNRRLMMLFGFVGAGIITSASLITALAYIGRAGETYSPLSHFVSELGHTADSERSYVFNLSLLIGGLAYGAFLLLLGLRFNGILRRVFALIGALTGISTALVACFPMDINLEWHGNFAFGFFNGSLVWIVLFSLVVGFARQTPYPRWMALIGVPSILLNLAFLALIFRGGRESLLPPEGARLPVWDAAALEWSVVISIMVWVTVITIWRAAHNDEIDSTDAGARA